MHSATSPKGRFFCGKKGEEVFVMSEKLTSGYEELEAEIIEESVQRYVQQQAVMHMEDAIDDQDPRVVETVRIVESLGFSIKAGQYYDLLK